MFSIYKIVDNTNGNIYVGSTNALPQRKWKHKNYTKYSSREIIKNNDYYFEVIEKCEEDKRYEREQYWMDNLDNVINKKLAIRSRERELNYRKNLYHYQNSWGGDYRVNNNLLKINPNLFL
tara:strand:- start:9177 stop:9539 length:363 start_codon:yes stop_codon:yes gene_type:complete